MCQLEGGDRYPISSESAHSDGSPERQFPVTTARETGGVPTGSDRLVLLWLP